MAVLAHQDWHLPRDHTMDVPSQSPSVPRQRSSPVNDHSPSHTPPSQQPPQQQQQQPYPYPVQQPQGGWTPSIAAQPFYPSFYQGPHQQQPYPLHGHSGGHGSPPPQLSQQGPYFDHAANAQLAQWAYQQMMFNAQHAHQISHIPPHHPGQQRGGAGGASSSPGSDYFGQNQISSPYSAFPSGTPPPPHPGHNHFPSSGQRGGAGEPQYNGFHPYRRPNNRQASHSSETEWRPPPGSFQPPYARNTDASGSTSSVNSVGSRQRTNSNQSSGGSTHNAPHAASSSARSRNGPPQISTAANHRSGSNSSSPSPSSSNGPPQRPHHRQLSSSSSNSTSAPRLSSSSIPSRPSVASASSSSSNSTTHGNPAARPARPSPLSQGTFTAAEKRMSRDDSDLAAMLEPTPSASMLRSGGLKGRLRRALSFNAANALREEEDSDEVSAKASRSNPKVAAMPNPSGNVGQMSTMSPDSVDTSDAASTATVQTQKKSRAASLFNRRLNASTDNISLSSTVSSASVMIRKLGSMGKLARRNSLAGITSLFKDKKDKEEDDSGGSKKDKKDKKKKSSKGDVSEASISHVTAELDRSSSGDWNVSGEMSGLSPAAKLARQHTLKSNAEAAARAKAQQEAVSAAASTQVNGTVVPSTWEKNTATRAVSSPVKAGGTARVNEDGTRVFVEDDDSGSENGSADGHGEPTYNTEGWDDDDDWGEGEEDEDVTIRVGLERTSLGEEDGENTEPWAADVRRSIERTRRPTKGILKYAGSYDQHSYLAEHTNTNRVRSNSYNSHPGQTSELGPLARIPSPDPDHIDGLHRHPSYSSSHSNTVMSTTPPFISTLPFESSGGSGTDSPKEATSSEVGGSATSHPEKSIFNHPNLNSSAPALSTILSSPPTLTHRAATAPAKRLAFANNLSVYDTFSASVYDRRSEPATWSRLTPALAQRIKEELNSYKMEEMEVHASSRIHTQFFV